MLAFAVCVLGMVFGWFVGTLICTAYIVKLLFDDSIPGKPLLYLVFFVFINLILYLIFVFGRRVFRYLRTAR